MILNGIAFWVMWHGITSVTNCKLLEWRMPVQRPYIHCHDGAYCAVCLDGFGCIRLLADNSCLLFEKLFDTIAKRILCNVIVDEQNTPSDLVIYYLFDVVMW